MAKKPGKKVKVAEYKSDVKEAVIDAVCGYLKIGYNLTTACKIAFVARPTFIDWCKKDAALRQKVQYFRHYLSIKARSKVSGAIDTDGVAGLPEAQWWLERKDKKDFSTRSEVVEVEDDEELQEDKDFSDIDEIIKKNQE